MGRMKSIVLAALMMSLIAVSLLSSCSTDVKTISGGPEGAKVKMAIKSADEIARDACVELCLEKKDAVDMREGPCLSQDLMNDTFWACDVAHSPRQDADDLADNQCSSFRQGKAKGFVEVDAGCGLIKYYIPEQYK